MIGYTPLAVISVVNVFWVSSMMVISVNGGDFTLWMLELVFPATNLGWEILALMKQ